ncbi:WhiB family transcriptional regulator [Janibacter terrae]|uniref:WhiB family transcriptional regulator n=1 Tax=Janibacter terrae TaxID=103817 RepID=UPI001B8C5A8F|nr:WhiB family transcriptional regulator [Janibacter terrae]
MSGRLDRRRMALETHGVCVTSGEHPDDWYPEGRMTEEQARRYAARQCAGCPVLDLCLEVALELDEDQGIRGGLSERDRRVLAEQRRRWRGLHLVEGQR